MVIVHRGAFAVAALLLAACIVATGSRGSADRLPRVGFVATSGVVPSQRTLGGQMLAGFLEAERKLRIQGRVVYLSPTQDPAVTLSYLARQKYDLLIVALPRVDIVYDVARKFPQSRFYLVDVPVHGPPHKPRNVQGSIFRAEQAGYLAGYLAALVEGQRAGKHVISAVGGFKYEGVDRWIVGYRAGARKADPRIEVEVGYTDDFTNPAKCRRVALGQIARGSGVVFNVAGACGVGALSAAKEERVWGIGVDIDQSFLGPQMLTSAVNRLDKGVFAVVQRLVQGRLGRAGTPIYFDVQNGGVELGKISPRVQQPLLRRLEKIRKAIAAGTIHVPRAS